MRITEYNENWAPKQSDECVVSLEHTMKWMYERAYSFMFLIGKTLIRMPLHALACQQYLFLLLHFWFSKHTFCARICLKINLTFVRAFSTVFLFLRLFYTLVVPFICFCYEFPYSFNSSWPWTIFSSSFMVFPFRRKLFKRDINFD